MSANNTVIIGLTGGIGSGKSEAAKALIEQGAVHVDADAISRTLTSAGGEALPAIREAFGDAVFNADGTLNRRALGGIVFKDDAARHMLEGILHPRVQRVTMDMIDAARSEGAEAVLLDVPLLFETGMDALCDETWVIYADLETRIIRVMARDGLGREEVEARIDAQMSDDERAERATRVIYNHQTLEKFRAEVVQYYKQLVKNAR